MTPEGYWLFARAWNRIEVFTAIVTVAEAARGRFFGAALVFLVGSIVSVAGKAKYRL